MAKETLKEQNERLLQELEVAQEQIQQLLKEVSILDDKNNKAYENSSFYKADQACIKKLKGQVETLKSQLTHSREEKRKADEEIRLLNLTRDVAVENMARAQDTRNDAYKETFNYKMLTRDLEAAHSDCRRLKHTNKQLKEDKELLEQQVRDLRNSLEEPHKNTLEIGRNMSDSTDQYERKIQNLEKRIRKLESENGKLRETSDYVPNARGAGRKRHNEEYMQKYLTFRDLVRLGKTMDDIMGIMQISRSTYFRFLKAHKEDSEIDEHEKSIKK